MTNNYSGILFMLLRYSAHPRDGIKLSERLWVKVWYPGKLGIALLKHRLLKHQVARIGFNPIGLQSDWIGCETSEFNFMKRRPRHPLHSKSTLRLTQRIHASLMHKGGSHFCPGWFQRCNPHLKSACRESNPIGLPARSKNLTHRRRKSSLNFWICFLRWCSSSTPPPP